MEGYAIKYFTKQRYEEDQLSGFLLFHESKKDWEEDIVWYESEGMDLVEMNRTHLENRKIQLLQFLPAAFHPYIHDGTLTTQYPSKQLKMMADQWRSERMEQQKRLGEQYRSHYKTIRDSLPPNVIQLMEKTLHDARVVRIERPSSDTLLMTLDCRGGYHYHTDIRLTFEGVSRVQPEDIAINSSWVYDEVYLTDTGFELHVLFECPLVEFTIAAENVLIEVLPHREGEET